MSHERIFVAGHRGMVGSAIVRRLRQKRPEVELITRIHGELDLTDQAGVAAFFQSHQIDQVYLAAARVGGIVANNTYPADFIRDNLAIQTNVISSAFQHGVKKLLFLGSSCIYPRDAAQPMSEGALLTGPLEPTNEPYAIAKIAGIKLCESYNRQHGVDYRSVMPTNLYGENDNFNLETSHVIPALIRKFHSAKVSNDSSVEVWGTGQPRREFLHVDDMAVACEHVMNLARDVYQQHTEPMLSHVNVGTGQDVTIKDLAEVIAETVGYRGRIRFDTSRPDGAPRKLLDVSRLHELGWRHSIDLRSGLGRTYDWFLRHLEDFRS
jgi:GDP-L-fucose synthase